MNPPPVKIQRKNIPDRAQSQGRNRSRHRPGLKEGQWVGVQGTERERDSGRDGARSLARRTGRHSYAGKKGSVGTQSAKENCAFFF